MTAPAKNTAAVSDSVKEGVFRFLKDFREGYEATSFGIYYQGFSLMQDARHMEEVGHIAELRFHRDATGRIDGMELVRLTPKAPALMVVDEVTWSQSRGSGRIEGGEGETEPSDQDSHDIPPTDFENGCDFCGHLDCPGCCAKCNDPKCYRTYGVCPTCTAKADAASAA